MQENIIQKTQLDNPISFRCPEIIKRQIEKKIAQTVIGNSTDHSLYHFTRTDLILESLIKANGFIVQEGEENSITLV
jgi:hypothetical protein